MALNVAIIGAGVSDLACAHQLEKSGIKPGAIDSFLGLGQFFLKSKSKN